MKFSTRWKAILAGLAGAAAIAGGLAKGGGSKPVSPPIVPPAATYTLTVHVYRGPIEGDHKLPSARVESGELHAITDGAGNVNLDGLPAGAREVCASAEGFTRECKTVTIPAGHLSLSLDRVVPPILPVRIDGRFFVTDAGTFRPIFQSGLTLLIRGPPERAAFLQETRALGFNGVRVFAGALPWAGQTPAGALAALPSLLDEAAAQGLYVFVSALTETRTGYDAEAHLRAVGTIVQAHPNAFLEIANEHTHPTQSDEVHDAERLAALARRAVPASVLYALGAPGYDEPQKVDPACEQDCATHWPEPVPGGFTTAHLDRGRDTFNQVRRLREIAAIGETTKRPSFSGEPIGAAEPSELVDPATGRPRQRRTDPEFFFAMGALCRGFELSCVFHSQDGLEAKPLGPTTRACAEAFLAGWRAIDTADRLQFLNARWAGSPIANATFWDVYRPSGNGVVRAYSFVAGGRGWTVLVGVNGDPGLQFGNGWRRGSVVAERPGVQVMEIAR